MKINMKKNGLCLFTLAAGLLCSVSLLKAEPENAAAPAYSPAQEKDEDGFYSFFAIVMPLGTRFSEGEYERAVKLAQAAGIKWTREEFFWGDIEPAKGKFSWEKYDRVVETARQNRLNLFGILDYSAAWAGSAGVCSPPRDFQDYGNFVYQTVSRYKDKIKYWEIWNECAKQSWRTPAGQSGTTKG